MLTDYELERYFEKHQLSARAREYIRQCIINPSRLVGTNARINVVSGFPSAKSGCTIQTESRTAEHARAIELEYSKTVLLFLDQTPVVNVVRTSTKGRKTRSPYTADFLVLDDSGPRVEEVKTVSNAEELVKKYPVDWVKTEAGIMFVAGNVAFAEIGLPFVVVLSSSTNRIRTDNLKLLIRARNCTSSLNEDLRDSVDRAFSEQAWMRLSELGARVDTTDLTPLIQLIDQGFLHASLSEELLSQPESAWIARSPEILAVRKTCSAEQAGYCAPADNEPLVSTTLVPSGKRADRALKNLTRLKAGDDSRTVRRLVKKIQRARQSRGEINEFLEALPDWDKSGNRNKRLCNDQLDFIDKFIKKHYANERRLSITAAHKLYKNLALIAHPLLPPASRPTLKNYIKAADQQKIAATRGGRRAENAASEPSPFNERQLLATRPFQLAVIDHYLTDIHCILVSRDGTHYTSRAWLTVMIDIVTGYVCSIWLSFRAPSRRACAMAIRLCVRKHGRLPEEILFDGGPEFESVYFYALLGHCRVGPILRPKEHPRYGAQGERFFNEFKTQWLSQRPGNLVSYYEARAVSRTHAPSKTAALKIEQLLVELIAFCEWRNANKVDLSNLSPVERVKNVFETFSCSGVPIINNAAFMVASAVDVKDYAIDPARGLHIGELHYWHPNLRKLASTGRAMEIREEPENPYQVYAKVGDEWVTCLATGAAQFATKDPVLRLCEAIRIRDGQKLRLEAKGDADQILITKMRELDTKWAADTAPNTEKKSETEEIKHEESIFDRIRKKSIESLKKTAWSKP